MTETSARNRSVERLAEYLLDGVTLLPGDELQHDVAAWLGASRRFAMFADANRDKIRKKLRGTSEAGARGDVRAELETAYLLLDDRRIELTFEAYGSGRRGPDFSVTFRAAHRFNLEVTRPRPRAGGVDPGAAIGHALLGKLRQLPADAPNAALIAAGLASSAEEVARSVRLLKLRAERRDEAFFVGRGLSAAEFQRQFRRLAVLLVAASAGPGVHAWSNPEASRPLPGGAPAALVAALAKGNWAAPTPFEASANLCSE